MVGHFQFPQLAMNNRTLVEQSTKAGCFHCCKIFEVTEIKKYTDRDKTCLCPLCNTDSVVGNNCGFELNQEILDKANAYWFKG